MPGMQKSGMAGLLFPGLLLAGLLPGPALAASVLSASAGVASDYRFRGVSRSAKEPVIEGGLSAMTPSGLTAGAFGVLNTDYKGGAGEIDVYAGIERPISWLDVRAGVMGYLYPGAQGANVVELYSSLEAPLGPGLLTLGLHWAPAQGNLARSNRYLYGRLAVGLPGTPLTLTGGLGFERGGWVPEPLSGKTAKTDYQLGVTMAARQLTFGLSYVGNNLSAKRLRNGQAANGIVARVGVSF